MAQKEAGEALDKALRQFEKDQKEKQLHEKLDAAQRKLLEIRVVIEALKGPDADYPTVEAALEEIEGILRA